jgi:hypothetical protein
MAKLAAGNRESSQPRIGDAGILALNTQAIIAANNNKEIEIKGIMIMVFFKQKLVVFRLTGLTNHFVQLFRFLGSVHGKNSVFRRN